MSLDIATDYAINFAEDLYYNRNNRVVPRNVRRARAHNAQERRERVRDRVKLGIAVIIRCYLIYMFLANLALAQTKVEVVSLDVESLSVNHHLADGNSVWEEGNTTLRVALQVNGHFNPSPQYVTSNLSATGIDGHPISTFSRSTFKMPMNGEQLIFANFQSHSTRLPKEQVELFGKYLKEGKVAIRLDTDFKWKLDKRMFLVFPIHHGHTTFSCKIPYTLLPIDRMHPLKCKYN